MKHQEKLKQEKLINDLKHEKALLRALSPPYLKVFSLVFFISIILRILQRILYNLFI